MSITLNLPIYICSVYNETPPVVQYVYYDDGVDYWRKGVRDGYFVLDKVIGPLGFYGVEGVGWENVKQVM